MGIKRKQRFCWLLSIQKPFFLAKLNESWDFYLSDPEKPKIRRENTAAIALSLLSHVLVVEELCGELVEFEP